MGSSNSSELLSFLSLGVPFELNSLAFAIEGPVGLDCSGGDEDLAEAVRLRLPAAEVKGSATPAPDRGARAAPFNFELEVGLPELRSSRAVALLVLDEKKNATIFSFSEPIGRSLLSWRRRPLSCSALENEERTAMEACGEPSIGLVAAEFTDASGFIPERFFFILDFSQPSMAIDVGVLSSP
nr:hypothetical protein Iba_chr02dCG14260 [Ipomoea batatas]